MVKWFPGVVPKLNEELGKVKFRCFYCDHDFVLSADEFDASKRTSMRRKCTTCGNWITFRYSREHGKFVDVSSDSKIDPDDPDVFGPVESKNSDKNNSLPNPREEQHQAATQLELKAKRKTLRDGLERAMTGDGMFRGKGIAHISWTSSKGTAFRLNVKYKKGWIIRWYSANMTLIPSVEHEQIDDIDNVGFLYDMAGSTKMSVVNKTGDNVEMELQIICGIINRVGAKQDSVSVRVSE